MSKKSIYSKINNIIINGVQMDPEIFKKFGNLFSSLKNALNEPSYLGSSKFSTDLTKVSVFLDVPEFIFIGEFLEWLFINLREIELDNENRIQMNDQIISLIDQLENNIPPFNEEFKLDLFDKLVKLRSDTTKIQMKYIARRKKPNLEDFLRKV